MKKTKDLRSIEQQQISHLNKTILEQIRHGKKVESVHHRKDFSLDHTLSTQNYLDTLVGAAEDT